jgi:hypothetical protein
MRSALTSLALLLVIAPAPAHADPRSDTKKLLQQFLEPGANHAALSGALRPTDADLAAIFEGSLARRAREVYGPMWDSGKMVLKPKPGQTNLLLWSATREELLAGKGEAKDFPPGWAKVAAQVKPGLRFYRFKFVEPSKDAGMAFDGLVFVNGHFVIVPKPFNLLEMR